jgi:hypothetical protein
MFLDTKEGKRTTQFDLGTVDGHTVVIVENAISSIQKMVAPVPVVRYIVTIDANISAFLHRVFDSRRQALLLSIHLKIVLANE